MVSTLDSQHVHTWITRGSEFYCEKLGLLMYKWSSYEKWSPLFAYEIDSVILLFFHTQLPVYWNEKAEIQFIFQSGLSSVWLYKISQCIMEGKMPRRRFWNNIMVHVRVAWCNVTLCYTLHLKCEKNTISSPTLSQAPLMYTPRVPIVPKCHGCRRKTFAI